MAIQGSRPQNRIILVIGVVLALVAGALAFVAVTKGVGTSGGGPSEDVWVALQPITTGQTLSQSLFTKTSVLQQDAPADPVTDITTVDNKTAPAPLSRGAILTQTYLAAPLQQSGGGGLLPVSSGDVALSIGVKGQSVDTSVELVTVGYYIRPGDHIDILVDVGGPGPNDHTIRYGFQDVRILAVGGQAAPAPAAAGATTAPAVTLSPPTYLVIELPRNQAELMTLLAAGKACDGPCQSGGAGGAAVNAVTIVKYVLRPSAEYGKADNNGNYLAPNYESAAGTAVPSKPDPGASSATVASAFPKP